MQNRRAIRAVAAVLAATLGCGVLSGCAGREQPIDEPAPRSRSAQVFGAPTDTWRTNATMISTTTTSTTSTTVAPTTTRPAAPVAAAPNTTTAPRTLVAVTALGDSIAAGAADPLTALAGGATPPATVTVDAAVGLGIDAIAAKAPAVVAAAPSAVWVSAGVNSVDTARPTNPALGAKIAKLMDATKPVGCVVWSTYSERVYGDAGWMAATAQLNRDIRAQAAARPWVQVADFAAAVAADASLVGSDGLHLTAKGNQRMAELVWDAAHRCSP